MKSLESKSLVNIEVQVRKSDSEIERMGTRRLRQRNFILAQRENRFHLTCGIKEHDTSQRSSLIRRNLDQGCYLSAPLA